ncbi:MAG: ROK family protein [Acidobacteria bacterium]|nr:ROK family protein [Acidobacteriota bacterium]MBA3888543.1 ROK family protein [Acidobacteriota bacterium]
MAEHFLGLDLTLRPPLTRAVVVDADGTVVRRYESRDAGDEEPDPGFEALVGDAAAAGVAVELDSPADDLGTGSPALGRLAPGTIHTPGAAAVTAEAWIGGARGARHVICLHIGDRVLAGVLLNGQPWSGAHGRAGSAAWLALNPVERQDYRKFGSLAAEASAAGIARRLSWRIQAGDHSDVLQQAGDLDSITAAHVFEGARGGDGVSISVVRETARYIGMALANLAVAIDPEVIVLSGSIAAAGDLLLEPVRQEFARRVPPGLADQIRIGISPLGAEGIAIGAARLAMLARA